LFLLGKDDKAVNRGEQSRGSTEAVVGAEKGEGTTRGTLEARGREGARRDGQSLVVVLRSLMIIGENRSI